MTTHPLVLLEKAGEASANAAVDQADAAQPKGARVAAGIEAGINQVEVGDVAGEGASTVLQPEEEERCYWADRQLRCRSV
jgi:hypothetical protein